MSNWTHERAKVASLARSRSEDDPDLVEARRNLRAERLELYIQRTIDGAPPLTDSQRARLAGLLRPGAVTPSGEAA